MSLHFSKYHRSGLICDLIHNSSGCKMDSFKFYDDFSEESHRLSFVNSSSDNQHFILGQKENNVKNFRTLSIFFYFPCVYLFVCPSAFMYVCLLTYLFIAFVYLTWCKFYRVQFTFASPHPTKLAA